MAVYTQLSRDDVKELLSAYDVGALEGFEGIAAGVSNTNYFVTTAQGRFILTLFEPHRVQAEDVSYFIDYANLLKKSGVPCPETIRRKDGAYHAIFKNRPAAIFSFLNGEGATPQSANPVRCHAAGKTLACMHLAAAPMTGGPDNPFSLPRWMMWVNTLSPRMKEIDENLESLTRTELDFIEQNWPHELPAGAIHGDYFPDNVFFSGDDVRGVIDFHFVCKDFFAYDLAIAINAWCFDEKNVFQEQRRKAFMDGYQSVRLLGEKESAAFPVLLRAAALRFLLSRIEEKLNWKEGDYMIPHDPMVFEKRLRHFRGEAA